MILGHGQRIREIARYLEQQGDIGRALRINRKGIERLRKRD
jgi:hypothetical protein